MKSLDESPDDRGLADPDFAGQSQKSLFAEHAVGEVRKGFPVRFSLIKELRIRRGPERVLVQIEIRFIHTG